MSRKAYILSFIAALAVANVSGPQYIYPTFGTSLASHFQWNGLQNSLVSTATFVGVSFSGPLNAYLVERFGIKNALRIASMVALSGLFLLAQTYAGYLSSNYLICAVYLVCIGAAGAGTYLCSLESQAHNFHKHRGMSMGLTSASLGISGLVFSQINDRFFKSTTDDTYYYLLFIGTSVFIVAFLGSFILGPLQQDEIIDVSTDLGPQIDDIVRQNMKGYTASVSSFSTTSTQVNEDNEESRPLFSKNVIVSAENTTLIKQEPNISGVAFFRDPVGFALSVALLVILGLGYVYLANIGQLLNALSLDTAPGEAQHIRNVHVSIFSIANCASRAVFGTLSDILQRKRGIHRLWFFWAAAIGLIVSLTWLVLFVQDTTQLIYCTILTAVVYGIAFGVAPATISEFGTKAFARNWGLLLCAPAIGSQSFNILFGTFYHLESKRQDSNVCYGPACFQTTFVIGIVSCLLCLVVLSLAIYKKGL